MSEYKLFLVLLGCRPAGRNTEQHDVYVGIATELKELIPEIKKFWKGAGSIHVDAWREVNVVDNYAITISEKKTTDAEVIEQLFFINLGGYKQDVFDEYHYKMLTVATSKNEAIATAKQSAFYLHTGFGEDATAHIDDKFGVDVDDIFDIKEILTEATKMQFSIKIEKLKTAFEADKITLGYFPLHSL